MKIIGLLPLGKDDYDILPKAISSLSWIDLIVIRPSDVPYDDVNQKALMSQNYDADWFVNLDADEVYSEPIDFSKVPDEYNVVTVDIYSYLNGRVYDDNKKQWKRAFRNQEFDFSVLAPLHKSRIPIKEQKCWDSGVKVQHYSIRNPEQGTKKLKRYRQFDKDGIQSYKHIERLVHCLETGDYSGVQWAN